MPEESTPRKSGKHDDADVMHRLRYQLVFVPQNHHRVLTGSLKTRVAELFRSCCEVHDWGLLELKVQRDHVHLLVQLPPTISVASAAKLLKDGSARILALEFPDPTEHLGESGFWSDDLFCESVGTCEEDMARRYVQNQHSRKKAPDG
jgi:putative transposase